MKYETVRDHVLNLSTQRMQMSKPTPMDIGGLEGENKGIEDKKGQEEGYGEEEAWDVDALNKDVKCYACQGFGHYARDCAWDKKKIGDQGKSKGKGKGQYQGKGGGKKGGGKKGAGKKGGGKGQGSGVVCWNCNKTGHKSDTCWSPKKIQGVEGEEVAECGGVWVIGAMETEGKGKGQGRMLYGDPYGFGGLMEEDEDEEKEDKPSTMVDSSEDEFVESREEEESEESEGEEDATLNFFEAFLTEAGGVFPVPEKNRKRTSTVVRKKMDAVVDSGR